MTSVGRAVAQAAKGKAATHITRSWTTVLTRQLRLHRIVAKKPTSQEGISA